MIIRINYSTCEFVDCFSEALVDKKQPQQQVSERVTCVQARRQ